MYNKPEICLETGFEKTVRLGLIILTSLCFVIALMGGYTQYHNWSYSIPIMAAFFVIIMLLSMIPVKTVSMYRIWLAAIFILALAARLIMLQLWPIEPISDFKDTYKVAEALAGVKPAQMPTLMQHEFEYYYTTWSVHMPYILLKMVIIKIFGSSYYAIQAVFSIFGALSCVMASLIAKSLYGKRAGVMTGMIMALLPLNLLFTGVLSNQHAATCFFLTAVYFLIGTPFEKNIWNVISAAVCTCISQLIRPEMIVFVIGVLCYFLYQNLLCKNARTELLSGVRRFLLYSVTFGGIYFVLLYGVNFAMMQGGIIAQPITETNMAYKVATGLNEESMGLWSEHDAALSEDEAALNELIRQRTADPVRVTKLMYQKLMYQFGTYHYSWCVIGETGEFVEHWYCPLTTDIMLIVLLLGLLRLIAAFYKRSRRETLLLITIIGYFMIFAVIEVQNRYNYAFIPIFIILASGGARQLAQWGKRISIGLKGKRKKSA